MNEMNARKKGRKCSMKYCDSFQHTHNHLSFFRFPKDPERSKLWIENSCRWDLIEKMSVHEDRVCELHFENHMFLSNYRNRLQSHAVPVLYLNGPPPRPMVSPITGRQMILPQQPPPQQQSSSLPPPLPQSSQPPIKRRHVEQQSMELFKKYETNDDLLTVMDVQEIHDFQRKPARSATTEQAYMEAAAEIRKTGASFRKAAEKFGVNYVTLRRYCARISKPQNMSHQNLDNPHTNQHQQNNQHQQPNNHYNQLNRQQQQQQQRQQQQQHQQQQQQQRKMQSSNQLTQQQLLLQQRQLLQQQQLQKQLYLQSLTKNLSPSTSLTATPPLNLTNSNNHNNNNNNNNNNHHNNSNNNIIHMNSQNSISLLQGNHLKNTSITSVPSPLSTPTATAVTTPAAAAAQTPPTPTNSSSSAYKRPRQIFSPEQEEELAGYVQDTSNYYSGLSSKDVRTLAFVYALCNQVEIPPGWRETYIASFDWCLGFIKRNKLTSMIVTGHSAYINKNNNGGVPYPSSIAGVALTPSTTSKMHVDNNNTSSPKLATTTTNGISAKSILPEVSPILNNNTNNNHSIKHKSLPNQSQQQHIIETIEL